MTQPTSTMTTAFTPGDSAAAGRKSSAMAATLGASRWSSDAFLDGLRQFGDAAADRCAVEISKIDDGSAKTRQVFATMTRNDQKLPDDAPAPLRDFFAGTHMWCDRCRQPALPAWVERDRVIRGQTVFMERMIPSVLVLLCKSLPEGYAAAGATKILNISGELLTHTYHRLMGTLQLLCNVSSPQSFERSGVALLNALQMRLLHAGVRSNVAPKVLDRRGAAAGSGYQAYLARYGVPINQEDLLATIMAFSLLVVRGLRALNIPLTNEEAEDFYYVWRVFAHLMGIHPPSDPEDASHLPENLSEASEFYAAYSRRHFAGETRWAGEWQVKSLFENPDGCALAERHLAMLATVLGKRESKFFDLRDITHLYVEMLIGEESCARVGIPRLKGRYLLRFGIMHLPRWWSSLWSKVDSGVHVQVSKWFLRSLLEESYNRGVVFTVPTTLEDLKALVHDGATPRGSLATMEHP